MSSASQIPFTLLLDTGEWPPLEITYRPDALVAISLVGRQAARHAGRPPAWLERMLGDLAAFLAGQTRSFKYVPLDTAALSDFQRAVIDEMRRIPYGETRTYGQIADALAARGIGTSARAVGQACAHNPFPLVVPCHRVVAGDGLGGFGWGSHWKKRLLSLEQAGCRRASGRAAPQPTRTPSSRRQRHPGRCGQPTCPG